MQEKLTLSTTALIYYDIDFVYIIAVTHTSKHTNAGIWKKFKEYVYSYKLASS